MVYLINFLYDVLLTSDVAIGEVWANMLHNVYAELVTGL
jgi:hypothetical protein